MPKIVLVKTSLISVDLIFIFLKDIWSILSKTEEYNVTIFFAVEYKWRMHHLDWRALWEDSRTQWERLGCIPLRLLRIHIFNWPVENMVPQRAVYNTLHHPPSALTWNVKRRESKITFPLSVRSRSVFRVLAGVFVYLGEQRQTWEKAGERERERDKEEE